MFEARRPGSRLLLQLVLSLLTLPFLLPLVAMVHGSLAGRGWGNYAVVLSVPQVPLFFRNSLIIAAATIAIVYGCTMLAAYGFAKLHIAGKEIYFWMLLAVLTLPEVVLIAPLFNAAVALEFYNTYWAVILPLAALQIPFAVLLTRTFVSGLPDALFEAARIDGAGTIRAFWSIVLPLTRPIAAAVVVLTLIGTWNSYLLPLIFLQDADFQVITQLPTFFQGRFTDDQTKVLASAVVTAAPIVVCYLFLQQLFERGLSAGALK